MNIVRPGYLRREEAYSDTRAAASLQSDILHGCLGAAPRSPRVRSHPEAEAVHSTADCGGVGRAGKDQCARISLYNLSIYPSIHLSSYLSMYLSLYLTVYLSDCRSVDLLVYPTIYLPTDLYRCMRGMQRASRTHTEHANCDTSAPMRSACEVLREKATTEQHWLMADDIYYREIRSPPRRRAPARMESRKRRSSEVWS